jgi:hypothetical protein
VPIPDARDQKFGDARTSDDQLTRDFIAGLTEAKEPTAEDIAKIIRAETLAEGQPGPDGKPIQPNIRQRSRTKRNKKRKRQIKNELST